MLMKIFEGKVKCKSMYTLPQFYRENLMHTKLDFYLLSIFSFFFRSQNISSYDCFPLQT